jgi:hypothetical protein
MDNSRTLRRKAARYFESAESTPTAPEADKLKELADQLKLWADDLDEIEAPVQKAELEDEAPGNTRSC